MKQNKIYGRTGVIDTQFLIDRIILKIAKERKQIVYGARSIQAQNNLFARDTKDYDIFDKNPKKTAQKLQRLLDKNAGFDYYYMKEAEHKGTFKVKNKGQDNIKNTEDDESIADYTSFKSNPYYPKRIPFVVIKGVRYRVLKEELKRKVATVQDPEYKFRREKDRNDINRIKGFIKVRQLMGGTI